MNAPEFRQSGKLCEECHLWIVFYSNGQIQFFDLATVVSRYGAQNTTALIVLELQPACKRSRNNANTMF